MYLIYKADEALGLKSGSLKRGLLYCVLIWESPLSEIILHVSLLGGVHYQRFPFNVLYIE